VFYKATPRLSKEATEEILREIDAPACTPQTKATSDRAKALAKVLKAKRERKAKLVPASRP
jgi:hypothetical protein